jgi:hypothetical protein
MNTALWIVQVLLGIMMLAVGWMKTFLPVARLNKFSWTTRSPEGFIRFVGVSELLIGGGLLLPQLTGILPILTPVAGLALCVVMLFAIVEHVRLDEGQEVWKNIVIMLLAAVVAVGRFTG